MKRKILYIEDEPFLGKIVKETLESQDFEVLLIGDGAKVMAAFDTFSPELCILDVMLPHVDGFTLGRQIRSRFGRLPIIFVTAKIETNDLIQGFESGGTDYIKKPFSIKETEYHTTVGEARGRRKRTHCLGQLFVFTRSIRVDFEEAGEKAILAGSRGADHVGSQPQPIHRPQIDVDAYLGRRLLLQLTNTGCVCTKTSILFE